ncbi:MAG TPA: PKD domain-containing protein [Verrucomicrobiae bacterium]|nr:PKD domain-containing protein [Verrucomicrobiae bacterium]
MKYTRLLIAVAALLLFPATAAAHLPGQPPFTFVNGEAALYYPVGFSSMTDFALPQDAAPKSYLVQSELTFSLATDALPLFPEELPFYTFQWEMGDGIKATGTEVKHTYQTIGSKVITITSKDTRATDPSQLLSTLYINIVPAADYKLPQPALSVNGRATKDLYTDSLLTDFTKRVTLDASKSTEGSAPIASYMWDLGNKQVAKDAKVNVTYQSIFSTVQPVVRITDKNGFFTDATVQLENSTLPGPNTVSSTPLVTRNWILGGLLALLALIAGATALWVGHLRTRTTGKSKRP